MAKKGRPFAYQSEEEKPVTVSLRIPREVYDQAQKYVKLRHPMTLTDLLLDGLRLRLETPADPRDLILSDDNTVLQEVQEMIRAAVQAEIGKLNTFMGSAFDALKPAPAPEAPLEPVPEISHDDNTVLQEVEGIPLVDPSGISYDDNTVIQEPAPKRPGRPDTMRQRILTLLHEHQEGLSVEEIRVYLKPAKPLGDILQGMRKAGVVKTHRSGKALRYVVA